MLLYISGNLDLEIDDIWMKQNCDENHHRASRTLFVGNLENEHSSLKHEMLLNSSKEYGRILVNTN